MYQDNYNTQRVHKVNVLLMGILVFLICGPVVFSDGIKESINFLIAGALVLIISIGTYFLPINTYLKGFILSILPTLVIIPLFILDGFDLNKHYIIVVSIAMVTLYFQKKLILAFGVIIDLVYMLFFFLNPEKFLGAATDFKGVTTVFFFNQCDCYSAIPFDKLGQTTYRRCIQ